MSQKRATGTFTIVALHDGSDGEDARYIYLCGTARDIDSSIQVTLPRIVRINGDDATLPSGRGLLLVTINRQTLAVVDKIVYDTYGEAVGESGKTGITDLIIAKLGTLDSSVFVSLTSSDAIGWSSALISKLQDFGLDEIPYNGTGRYPFAFLGYLGLGKGYALLQMHNTGSYDHVAEIGAYVVDGTFVSSKDGANGDSAIQLTLDNQHEDFLYSDSGLVSPTGGATSPIHLYDGQTEKTDDVTIQVYDDNTNTWGASTDANASAAASVTQSSGTATLSVTALRADSVKVRVRAKYPNDSTGKFYYAEFTSNKTSQDKYDLVVSPSSIAYNHASYNTKRIMVYANRTNLNNATTQADISTSSDSGTLRLFATYNGSTVQITNTVTDGDKTKHYLDVTDEMAAANDGIYLELRKYSGTSFAVVDYETVEIAKVANGEAGTRYQRIYKSTNSATYTGDEPSGDRPEGWSAVPTAITQQARYRYLSERYSNDGGATWSDWSTPQIDAYLSEDGTSIQIEGEAKGVVAWGGSLPPTTSAVDGDTWLHNDNTSDDMDVYEEDWEDPGHGSWDGRLADMGDGYLINGYLWMKVSDTATATQVRWKNVGLIQGPQGEAAVNVIVEPAAIIVTQDLNNTNNLSSLSGDDAARSVITVMKGSTPLPVTQVTNNGVSHCAVTLGVTSDTTAKGYVQLSSVATYTPTGATESKYYGSGYVMVNVTYNDNGTLKTVSGIKINFYANLLGTWSQTVIGDAEKSIARKITYAVTGNAVDTIETVGQYIRSSTENMARLTREDVNTLVYEGGLSFPEASTISVYLNKGKYKLYVDVDVDTAVIPSGRYKWQFAGHGSDSTSDNIIEELITISESGSYTFYIDDDIDSGSGVVNEILIKDITVSASEIKQTADAITARVETNKGNISQLQITANGLTSEVSQLQNGKNLLKVASGWEVANGDTSSISYSNEFGVLDSNGDLYSPIVDLQANTTYCFSAEFDGDPTSDTAYALAPASGTYTHNSDVYDHGTTYNPSWQTAADGRKYFTFTTGNAACKFVFNQYFQSNNNIYRPQLELGSVPTPFEASTMEVSSKILQTAEEIEQKVENTGIDITNGLIKLIADKTSFSSSDGTPLITVEMYEGMPSIIFYDSGGKRTDAQGNVLGRTFVLNWRGFLNLAASIVHCSWTTLKICFEDYYTGTTLDAEDLYNNHKGNPELMNIQDLYQYHAAYQTLADGSMSYILARGADFDRHYLDSQNVTNLHPDTNEDDEEPTGNIKGAKKRVGRYYYYGVWCIQVREYQRIEAPFYAGYIIGRLYHFVNGIATERSMRIQSDVEFDDNNQPIEDTRRYWISINDLGITQSSSITLPVGLDGEQAREEASEDIQPTT